MFVLLSIDFTLRYIENNSTDIVHGKLTIVHSRIEALMAFLFSGILTVSLRINPSAITSQIFPGITL